MKYDLVCEGGGVKGIALVGAINAIENLGFTPGRMAGTSAGAIVASLRAAGYDATDLRHILLNMDFQAFKDGNGFGKKVYNLVKHHGIYKGDYFYNYIRELLASKNVYTFGDLLSEDKEDHENTQTRWTFKCFATDITTQRLVTFPDDALIYGIDPNELDVATAVRCSMSIPGFFYPMTIGNRVLVDGGLLSNFPISVWDAATPRWPTFGLLLDEARNARNNIGKWPHQFVQALFNTMMKAHDKRDIKLGDFIHRTIKIPVGTVSTTDFDLSAVKKKFLYDNGKDVATTFLTHWSWDDYYSWATDPRRIE